MGNKFESLSQFVRGQDSKKSLGVGYITRMEKIAEDLDDSVNMGADVQYEVGISNHPDNPGNTVKGYNNPVYTITGGLEQDFGLPKGDSRIVNYSIFIDPFDLAISGEIGVMELHRENEKDEFFEIKPEEIENVELSTMSREIRKMTDELFTKANIELE
jgi:hypothetical protein